MHSVILLTYFLVAVLFIVGLKKMSSPRTARTGIWVAGAGMLLAVFVTLFDRHIIGITNYILIISAIAIGAVLAWVSGKRVQITNMPQMIAIYNGMGGGAAAAIAAMELMRHETHTFSTSFLALAGAFVGTVSFSGSIIAYAKLQGILQRIIALPYHQLLNAVLLLLTLVSGSMLLLLPSAPLLLLAFFVLLLLLGILVTLPIGGANMPVVISLFNAMTGLAVSFEGFVLGNSVMIIAGTVVGASGTLLTQLMAKAMNQNLSRILFVPHVEEPTSSSEISGSLKPIEVADAAIILNYSRSVIIVPGYGMAVAQAQHKVWELAEFLATQGIAVKFAIHPVAGRMPGHMNVLLAEAGVPYDQIFDLEEINQDFDNTDVAIVIGANDVVNPAARTRKESPIYGMPILNADKAKNVIVIKRGQGKGFSGIENELFYLDQTRMLYGDGTQAIAKLIQAIKQV